MVSFFDATCLAIINNNQIMKQLSFRNSSKAIQALLAPHPHTTSEEAPSFYDEDLQFSTFRSDDYRFYEHFPPGKYHHQRGETSQEDSSFNILSGQSSDSESQSEAGLEEKKLSSIGSTNESAIVLKGVSFRNSSKLINGIIFKNTNGIRIRGVGFRNGSVLLGGLLGCGGKEI